MSTCPEKDLHSIYLDGELPEEFLKEYETHVAGCEKCQAELEKLKKVSVPFREDALSVKLDQTYLDQSFARLQTKMRFKETAERCEKSYIIRPYIKWVSGFAAAAAVFAVIVTPLSLKSNSKEQKELTAIEDVLDVFLPQIVSFLGIFQFYFLLRIRYSIHTVTQPKLLIHIEQGVEEHGRIVLLLQISFTVLYAV